MPAVGSQVIAECHGIRCREDRLCEIDKRGVAVLAVPRGEIDQITLRYGLLSHHPVVQLLMAFTLIAGGVLGSGFTLQLLLQHHGDYRSAAFGALIVLGLWLAIDSFKHGYYLEVRKTQGRQRLAFHRKCSRPEIDAFVATVEAAYGVRVGNEA